MARRDGAERRESKQNESQGRRARWWLWLSVFLLTIISATTFIVTNGIGTVRQKNTRDSGGENMLEHMRQRDFAKMEELAQKWLQEGRNRPVAHYVLATIEAAQGEWDAADSRMETAIEALDMAAEERSVWMCWVQLYDGHSPCKLEPRPDDFFRVVDNAIRAKPDDDDLHRFLIHRIFWLVQKIQANGEPAIERVIGNTRNLAEKHPDNGWVRWGLGRLMRNYAFDMQGAVSQLALAARLSPETRPIRYELGDTYLLIGEPAKAEQELTVALEIPPPEMVTVDDAVILLRLGVAQVLQGQFQRAQATCQACREWGRKQFGEHFQYQPLDALERLLERLHTGNAINDDLIDALATSMTDVEKHRQLIRRHLTEALTQE